MDSHVLRESLARDNGKLGIFSGKLRVNSCGHFRVHLRAHSSYCRGG